MGTVARAEDFEHLRAAFHPSPGSETERLIDQAALSNRIFAPYSMKPRPAAELFYRSGEQRETNMKRLFAEQYKKAQAAVPLPKVLAMFGQLHMYRGRSEGLGSVFRYGVISRIANDCRSKYHFEKLIAS